MSATPTLSQVIGDAIETRLTKLHTMMPGIITAVDVKAGKCTVQPSIQRLGSDGNPKTLPPIANCPIKFYRCEGAAIYLPIKVGSKVSIEYCERSLDIWLVKGGTVSPEDQRKHNLSDATVYPGLYDFGDPPEDADPENLVIINGNTKITMTPDGKFKLQGTDEVLSIISDLINKLTTVKTPTMMGPQTFLSTDITDLEALKTRIDGMKG